ncbi:exodeoxyribonuclease VII large subunit [Campylobacter sp. RM16192]|uniref:exodeoxyribonuclease VII large subunit n=1 Tax=Campylobacter sp. RM16192 TaxID=1660080 RepID=UPI0014520350|nr:exodeoxyribonuclease VII large subunit [Campylobacter sp. RM16192]QCD53268.1 exodeoxyribonuclease VII, large subunit [Campylobacter sp. RM16192]
MLSVSELNEQAKTLLETTFSYVEAEGEISRLTKHASGHWYFTLKDAKASISAVIYKFNNEKLKFDIKDGMKVIIYGKISLYSPSGSYQLIATSIRPSGDGELELAFKQLKESLEKEGLFKISNKKSLPKFPKKIGIITSKTSAALQDMLKIINQRWILSEIFIFDSLTQGENAPKALIKALKKADSYGLDVIVLARGGGSREDLWCFNDECLAREIYISKTPIISAIGHEIDYVITDFVADFRAPTPSAAMTSLLPDMNEFMQMIDRYLDAIDIAIKRVFECKESSLNMLKNRLSKQILEQKIDHKYQILNNLNLKLKNALNLKILKFENQISILNKSFMQQERFFDQISSFVRVLKDGKIANLNKLKTDDEVVLSSVTTTKKAKIL